jgi:SAM-dependent methyltransferase
MKPHALYNQNFYLDLKDKAIYSARQIVPRIMQLISCSTVVDVGCGTGEWLSVFREAGVNNIIGIDGDYVDRTLLCIPADRFFQHDLRQPLQLERQFDLAISLEVAEHLPAECADMLVTSLTQLSSAILFSASIPFQEGTGHLNEQWPDYWIELFRQRGFVVIDCLRREFWENPEVAWWYKQNLLLFICSSKLECYPKLSEIYKHEPHPFIQLIHPDIYLHHVRKAQVYKRIVEKKPVQIMLAFKEYLRRFNNLFFL